MEKNRKKDAMIVASCFLFLAIVLALLVVHWIYIQENIVAKPEEIIRALGNSGFEIENIRYMDEEEEFPDFFDSAKSGARFSIGVEGQAFDVLIIMANSLKEARRMARNANQLDSETHGGFGYTFHYGLAMVQIFPSNKKVGEKLHDLLTIRTGCKVFCLK